MEEEKRKPRYTRSFWQATEWAEKQAHSAAGDPATGAVESIKLGPKFVLSNATSHKWALGAMAELLDNSMDAGARTVDISVREVSLMVEERRQPEKCIVVRDDGWGMTANEIKLCLGLGYSMHKNSGSIGGYGNGLKSGAMRLGACLFVLTRHKETGTLSAGLYSYAFITQEIMEGILIPMISWNAELEPAAQNSEWHESLAKILRWGPYSTREELERAVAQLPRPGGTEVMVTYLWENADGSPELLLDLDPEDICLDEDGHHEKYKEARRLVRERGGDYEYIKKVHHLDAGLLRVNHHKYSLRDYIGILYLKYPARFKHFILRGKKVQVTPIEKTMIHVTPIRYKPHGNSGSATGKVGFVQEGKAPMINGCANIYHKGRLMRPYLEIFQSSWSTGRGVTCVVEQDIFTWTHNKQDFETGDAHKKMVGWLNKQIKKYFNETKALVGYKMDAVKKEGQAQEAAAESLQDGPSSSAATRQVPRHSATGGSKRAKSEAYCCIPSCRGAIGITCRCQSCDDEYAHLNCLSFPERTRLKDPLGAPWQCPTCISGGEKRQEKAQYVRGQANNAGNTKSGHATEIEEVMVEEPPEAQPTPRLSPRQAARPSMAAQQHVGQEKAQLIVARQERDDEKCQRQLAETRAYASEARANAAEARAELAERKATAALEAQAAIITGVKVGCNCPILGILDEANDVIL